MSKRRLPIYKLFTNDIRRLAKYIAIRKEGVIVAATQQAPSKFQHFPLGILASVDQLEKFFLRRCFRVKHACPSESSLIPCPSRFHRQVQYTPACHARSGILPPRLRHNYLLYCSILFSSRASFLEIFRILKQLITRTRKVAELQPQTIC